MGSYFKITFKRFGRDGGSTLKRSHPWANLFEFSSYFIFEGRGDIYFADICLLCRCSVSTAVSHLCHNSATVYLQHFSYSEARLADKRNINRELVAQYHDIYKQQLCNSADGRLSF